MGIEKLWVRMGYRKPDLQASVGGMDGKVAERYSGKEILLDPEFDEYYAVLTRGMRGQGFGWPRLRTVFRTLSQNESMEVGESQLACGGRIAIIAFYNGRMGFLETVKQFEKGGRKGYADEIASEPGEGLECARINNNS
jgi:hypothetical protein